MPVSSSAYSDVYQGEWRGRMVALKALRVHIDTQADVIKVGVELLVASISSLIINIGISHRGGGLEAPQAPEYRRFPWRVCHFPRVPR